jgi:hypothetical protein
VVKLIYEYEELVDMENDEVNSKLVVVVVEEEEVVLMLKQV